MHSQHQDHTHTITKTSSSSWSWTVHTPHGHENCLKASTFECPPGATTTTRELCSRLRPRPVRLLVLHHFKHTNQTSHTQHHKAHVRQAAIQNGRQETTILLCSTLPLGIDPAGHKHQPPGCPCTCTGLFSKSMESSPSTPAEPRVLPTESVSHRSTPTQTKKTKNKNQSHKPDQLQIQTPLHGLCPHPPSAQLPPCLCWNLKPTSWTFSIKATLTTSLANGSVSNQSKPKQKPQTTKHKHETTTISDPGSCSS